MRPLTCAALWLFTVRGNKSASTSFVLINRTKRKAPGSRPAGPSPDGVQ